MCLQQNLNVRWQRTTSQYLFLNSLRAWKLRRLLNPEYTRVRVCCGRGHRERRVGRRREVLGHRLFDRAAIALAILCSAVNLWQGYPFAETAPIGLTLMVVVPILLAAGVVHLMRRGPWLLRWLYAMLAAFIGVFPAYMLGCIVSDWLPVPGCFF